MATYRLFIKASAAKEIERLTTKKLRRAIVARIRTLADAPRPPGCVKLSGADKYRLRQGDYRILYEIVADRLVVRVSLFQAEDVIRLADRQSDA